MGMPKLHKILALVVLMSVCMMTIPLDARYRVASATTSTRTSTATQTATVTRTSTRTNTLTNTRTSTRTATLVPGSNPWGNFTAITAATPQVNYLDQP
jgi:carbohydrate-binding DOMON domain-containing protein